MIFKRKIYNTSKEVDVRLLEKCKTPLQASILSTTWFNLSIYGEDKCKLMYNSKMLKQHKALLKKIKISWTNTDINPRYIIRAKALFFYIN